MSTELPHLLLVEDDKELSEWINEYFSHKGYRVTVCDCGQKAADMIPHLQPDLVILDGMLPGMDGFDVCKTVRSQYSNPIIMLTARDEEIDEVLGIEAGADDYLIKPVRARALLARIQSLLKKNQAVSSDEENCERLQFDSLIIDKQARVVSLAGEKLKISSNEFDVLWLLAQKSGSVVSREELVQELRGFGYDGHDRSIDLRISRLRKKLKDDPSEPYRIKTIWGKGYQFARDAW